jgi:hypothetical protein
MRTDLTPVLDEAFAATWEQFTSVVKFLADPRSGEMTHTELEERLEIDARNTFRQALQDHLDLRAVREQRLTEVIGADVVARTSVEEGHERALATLFGEVTVSRLAYRARGHSNLHPADAALNLPTEKHSHGLRRLAAIEATRGSFDAAAVVTEQRVDRGQPGVAGGDAVAPVVSRWCRKSPIRAASRSSSVSWAGCLPVFCQAKRRRSRIVLR